MTEKRDPVHCAKGHLNDPYPEDGRCVQCKIWLPGNPFKTEPGYGAEISEKRDLRREQILKRAKQYVEEAGREWDNDIDAILQDLAIRAVTTKDRHDMSLLLVELGKKHATPKSSEEVVAAEFSVVITGETVATIQESIDELDALSRD